MKPSAWAMFAGMAVFACQVRAGVPRPTRADFSNAPRDLRGFLIKARQADRIKDSLKRCLAYPGYSGNHGPKGLAKAECHCRISVEPGGRRQDVKGQS
jgi:hypothetical protein